MPGVAPVADPVSWTFPGATPVTVKSGEVSWPAGTTTLVGETVAIVPSGRPRATPRPPGGAASESTTCAVADRLAGKVRLVGLKPIVITFTLAMVERVA